MLLADLGPGMQVHKFSKFIHGTATLLPDMVQAVPYWIDEGSLRESVLNSAPTAAAIPQAKCVPVFVLAAFRSCLPQNVQEL